LVRLLQSIIVPSVPNFYHSEDIFRYAFSPSHPLKPERMRRTLRLLDRLATVDLRIADRASAADIETVHDPEYVAIIQDEDRTKEDESMAGLYGDNPPFPGMYGAAAGYMGVVQRAAMDVRDGASIAFGLGGGLHHAHRNRASGFCIFSDGSLAIKTLRERFEQVAYVDIDLHHGDGVQGIWLNDPRVLTYSIHESGRTLFPGSGFAEETGTAGTSINVPLVPNTASAVWIDAFRRTALPALERFQPQAIVLQMGTDAHFADPLGHLRITAQDWLAAVAEVRNLGLPMVVTGGGGYNLQTVPRMWVSAILSLCHIPFDDQLPADLAEEWQIPTFFDRSAPGPADAGAPEARKIIEDFLTNRLPGIPRP
jgi:acetoin utilization protein AcuC